MQQAAAEYKAAKSPTKTVTMTKIPNIVRDRLKAAPAGDHPDANLLTAFAEQALPDRERIQVLEHVARCADCRDLLALATPPMASTTVPGHKDTASARKVSWFGWPMLRWGALAACVVVVGTAVFVRHDLRRSQTVAYMKSDAMPQAAQSAVPQPPAISENAVSDFIAKEEKQEPERARKAEHDKKTAFAAAKPVAPAQSALASAPFDSTSRAKKGSAREDYGYLALSSKNEPPKSTPTGLSGGALRTTPAPAVPQQWPGKDEGLTPPAVSLPLNGRNVVNATGGPVPAKASQSVQVSGANEAVEVQSAAVQAETSTMQYSLKKEAQGKAKGAAADSSVVTLPASATNFEDKTLNAAAETRASRLESELARGAFASSSRWTISSDGQLQHSVDSGKTWQPITVADKATFRALSANGPDLWIGGPAGLLYHSSDAGGHWTQIKPLADGATLATDIATIEFTDRQHGKLTTSTGEIWITADAGQTWRKRQS
jgi:Photosynthesis system II assembly factor YCF48/Putative zinc-finger